MDCPRCGAPLDHVEEGLFEDIPVLACASCGGAFYPEGSLDRLDDCVTVDVEALAYEPVKSRTALSCPSCASDGYREHAAVALERVRPPEDPSLVVARCPRCDGFWLDAGQLELVQALALQVSSDENAVLNESARKAQEEARKRSARAPAADRVILEKELRGLRISRAKARRLIGSK
jgi:Zn-finger nucleic acid-binding protein